MVLMGVQSHQILFGVRCYADEDGLGFFSLLLVLCSFDRCVFLLGVLANSRDKDFSAAL